MRRKEVVVRRRDVAVGPAVGGRPHADLEPHVVAVRQGAVGRHVHPGLRERLQADILVVNQRPVQDVDLGKVRRGRGQRDRQRAALRVAGVGPAHRRVPTPVGGRPTLDVRVERVVQLRPAVRAPRPRPVHVHLVAVPHPVAVGVRVVDAHEAGVRQLVGVVQAVAVVVEGVGEPHEADLVELRLRLDPERRGDHDADIGPRLRAETAQPDVAHRPRAARQRRRGADAVVGVGAGGILKVEVRALRLTRHAEVPRPESRRQHGGQSRCKHCLAEEADFHPLSPPARGIASRPLSDTRADRPRKGARATKQQTDNKRLRSMVIIYTAIPFNCNSKRLRFYLRLSGPFFRISGGSARSAGWAHHVTGLS